MNKPAMAIVGLMSACAACCAIPIAVPLLGGISVAALAWLTGHEVAVASAALVLAGLLAGAVRWRRALQRKSPSAAGPNGTAVASRCGCSVSTSKEGA